MVSFVGAPCGMAWATNRLEHIPALGIVRRDAYSNDQWNMAGAQLMRAHISQRRWFDSDPSQIVTAAPCRGEWWKSDPTGASPISRAIPLIMCGLLDPPPFDPYWTRGMTRMWFDGSNALYRIDDRSQPRSSPEAFRR